MHLDFPPSESDVILRVRTGIDVSQQDTGGQICYGKVPKFSLIGKEWDYRGEGNGSLVLAVAETKTILRMTKVGKNDSMCFRDSSEVKLLIPNPAFPVGSLEETMERLVFSNNLMGRLLGASLVKQGLVFHMEEEEVETLSQKLLHIRPETRIHKRLNPVGLVVLYPDCTLLQGLSSVNEYQTYCVEIKPKQGFKSSATHRRCPFCLNQFLKAKNGKIARRSSYCPLDLFSGSYRRMVRAARELIRTPQNNLRIFKEGKLVLSEENSQHASSVLRDWLKSDTENGHSEEPPFARSFLNFAHLIIQALTSPLLEKSQPISSQGVPYTGSKNGNASLNNILEIQRESGLETTSILDPCDTRMERLPEHSLLDRLLRTQKLGEVPADGLYDAYDIVAGELQKSPNLIDRLRWSYGDYRDTNWILKETNSNEFEKALKVIQRYRILATARDCSIMVIFKRTNHREDIDDLIVEDLEGRLYICQLSVVDLDPKPITCVLKHRRRERSMTEAYCQAVNSDITSSS